MGEGGCTGGGRGAVKRSCGGRAVGGRYGEKARGSGCIKV